MLKLVEVASSYGFAMEIGASRELKAIEQD
jgi:hypothetical protein